MTKHSLMGRLSGGDEEGKAAEIFLYPLTEAWIVVVQL